MTKAWLASVIKMVAVIHHFLPSELWCWLGLISLWSQNCCCFASLHFHWENKWREREEKTSESVSAMISRFIWISSLGSNRIIMNCFRQEIILMCIIIQTSLGIFPCFTLSLTDIVKTWVTNLTCSSVVNPSCKTLWDFYFVHCFDSAIQRRI